jgi:EmrB/QacA subfamily drug resistance transporter
MKKWVLFYALMLSIVIVDLDMTAVNMALATMATQLHLSLSTAQWIVDGYTIAAAALATLGGRLGELYGARRVLISALVVFAIASLSVGLADSSWLLIVSRILQGACTAVVMPVALVSARGLFPASRQGFMMGLMISVASFAQALGPTFGGLMIHYFSWRWIFLINVPLATIIWLAVFYGLPHSDLREGNPKIAWRAASYLVSGLLLMMLSLNEVVNWGLFSVQFVASSIASIVLLTLFIRRERDDKQPLLELKLLMNKACAALNLIRIALFFVYFTYLFTLSIFLQHVLDFTPMKSGFILLFMTLVFGVSSIPSGRLIDRIGYKKPLSWSILSLMLSAILMAQLTALSSIYFLGFSLLIAGVSIAVLVPSTTVGCLKQAPEYKQGAAMGLLITTGFIGISLGVALSGALLSILNTYQLHHAIVDHSLTITSDQLLLLERLVTGAQSIGERFSVFPKESIEGIPEVIREAFIFGFSRIMWLCALLCFGSYLMSHLLIREKS